MGSQTRIAFVTALALAGCDNLEQDDFVYQGGISPDPTAVLEGSVLYIGPRPKCEFAPDGKVQQIVGRVALTLFEYTNPPPPEGSASSALNLMFVDGDQLFNESDCLPKDYAGPSLGNVTRSVPFQWPRVPLYPGRAVDYQIRGFYDYDGDMIPFFSVTRIPTAGDIIGAAVNDVRDASKGLYKIALPRLEDALDGFVSAGITVALGEAVRTERPAFALDANRFLSAERPFNPALNGDLTPNPPNSLRAFRAASCAGGGTDGVACGLTLQPLTSDLAPRLLQDGVQIDLADPVASAFYTAPIDIKTTVLSGVDLTAPDGVPDPHPFLGGGLGIPWYAPGLILQRLPDPARASIETQARIPRVLMVGSILLDDNLQPLKRSYVDTGVPVAVPPVAAAELIPGRSECRVPYFAPGTLALVMNGRLGNCAELPTGRFSVNVLAGLAGGTPTASTDPTALAESPTNFPGSRYSGQSWTLPNELGDPTQTADVIASQSITETFVVHDPSSESGTCATATPKGLCSAGLEVSENELGVDSTACLLPDCCAYVSHLCGLPTCPMIPIEGGVSIASSPTAIVGTSPINGAPVPDCVPFQLPWQCCPEAEN